MQKVLTIILFCISISLTFLLTSCGGSPAKSPQDATSHTMGAVIPADFVAFYDQFHSDSSFQMDHIVWPLAGNLVKPTPDAGYEDVRWRKADWKLHLPLDENYTFKVVQEAISEELIVEVISSQQSNYKILRRFAKIAGEWNLIHYQVSTIDFSNG